MVGGLRARSVAYLKRPRGGRGFTVIEVLIVLAVTGGLFVSAAIMIAGRQQQTEFNQAIRQVQSQIQQVMNEVAIGFYPNTGSFQCTPGPSGPVLTTGSTEQGENSGCIFMGKAIQFELFDSDPERFVLYTIAGLQKGPTGKEVTSRAEAMPKVVAPSTSTPSVPDNTSDQQLQGGLTTHRMWYDNGAGEVEVGVVVFMSSLASYSGDNVVSGSQRLHLIPVNGTALDETKTATAEAINANIITTPRDVSGGVHICFVSGGTNQSGLITIGDSGRQLSVTLSIKSNKTCA